MNFRQQVEAEFHNLLDFWSSKTIDYENGGFYGRIDGNNILHSKADKCIILNTRILWTFSAAAQKTQKQEHINIARRAKDYILNHFWDYDKGGVFWMLDYKGNVIDTKKQIYAQGFTMYALSEYFLLTGDETAKSKAIDLFYLMEEYSFDTIENGYLEAFSKDWKLLEDLRLSDKDANEKKTMNTHLHIVEAYTNLYRIWKNDELKQQLTNLIQLFLNKIINSKTHHLHLFFDEFWNIKSHEISFGHDIETSWLLTEAAEVLGDEKILAIIKTKAVKMAATTLAKAVDTDYSILYESQNGKISDSDRHWWVQAEAVVGFVNAFQITSDKRYLEVAQNTWQYIDKHIIDHKNGEWFWRLNHRNIVNLSENKVGPWKAPYHNVRACLEILHRIS